MRYLNYYREVSQKMYGYAASSDQIGWSAPVYVSDTDQKARDEAKVQAALRASMGLLWVFAAAGLVMGKFFSGRGRNEAGKTGSH